MSGVIERALGWNITAMILSALSESTWYISTGADKGDWWNVSKSITFSMTCIMKYWWQDHKVFLLQASTVRILRRWNFNSKSTWLFHIWNDRALPWSDAWLCHFNISSWLSGNTLGSNHNGGHRLILSSTSSEGIWRSIQTLNIKPRRVQQDIPPLPKSPQQHNVLVFTHSPSPIN